MIATFFAGVTFALGTFFVFIGRVASGRTRPAGATAIGIASWLALTGVLAWRGFYRDFEVLPPRLAFVVIPALTTVAVLASSRRVRDAVSRVPGWWLIAVQIFRLPLEIVLHQLYADGVIPREMTYEGLNFDIVTGITAPFAAYVVSRRGSAARATGIAWNIMGLALVLTITVVSILSTPTFLRVFTSGPANTFVAEFPFIWLPALIVPSAILLHLWSLTNLWRRAP